MEEKQVASSEPTQLKAKEKKPKKTKSITVKANKKGRHIMGLLNFLRVLIIPVYFLLRPFRFYGNRKVKDGAYIYISNHYGMLDPVYTAATTWEGIHYVAKRQAFETPVLGPIMKKVKAISVNRDGNDVRGLLDCFKCLKNGEKICIYPEGTRNKTGGEMLPFRPGAATMAIKTKTPILPVVVYNKPRFFRCTHILMGEPFELSEYYDRKLSEEEIKEVDDALRDHMIGMKKTHAEFLADKKRKKKA